MTEPARLTANPRNPNRMSDEDKVMMRKALAEFGDLGGIVYNRRSGYLLGGHQRFSVMEGAELTVDDLREPEPDGTVARGYLTHKGRRYAVRVVDWPEEKANRAMIAANRFGRLGQDEMSVLKDLLQELDTGATDMDTTGYTAAALEKLMTQVPPEVDTATPPGIPECRIAFPARVWLTQRAEIIAALQGTVESFGGTATWPD